jgi:hypothetical protein
LLKVALNTINLTPSISMEVFFFRNKLHEKKIYYLDMNMIDTEKYQHATFNNISVISWRSVLLVDETRAPEENHRPVACP